MMSIGSFFSGGPRAVAMVFVCLIAGMATAGSPLLKGRVTDLNGGPARAEVRIAGTSLVAATDRQGHYMIEGELTGERRVVVQVMGRTVITRTLTFQAGQTLERDFQVDQSTRVLQHMVVTTSRTSDVTETVLSESQVREMPAPVTGELLRGISGVEAVRRGPVGLDPVVQGLRETEVGAYLDGTRLFPGGPGRMDSALSHLDPGAMSRVQVVKGPYALTWGAGNLSAIRVDTFDLDGLNGDQLGGSVNAGYQSNRDAGHASATLFGKSGELSYWVHGVGREGDDYEDGHGQTVEADMSSRELRAKMAYDFNDRTRLTLGAGAQRQDDIDYPGRLLNAEYFETQNLSVTLNTLVEGEVLVGWDVIAYHNAVDHRMNNLGKPTAMPMPGRTPPFALDIGVDSEIQVDGGAFGLDLNGPGAWNFRVGADFYRAQRDALRTIARADTGMVMFTDAMWPDAVISDLGLYAHGVHHGPRLKQEITLRLDQVEADAHAVSDFFRANASVDTDTSESNLSAAYTAGFNAGANWYLGFGLGSAVRTADATERYSDRIPSTKAQISAEFMGNPNLEPERSNQLDLWATGQFGAVSLNVNLFARRIEDYITLEATDLVHRLPLSPATVYRYINGEAEFVGLDTTLAAQLNPNWRLNLAAAWLEGDDTTLDEPVIGIAPLKTSLTLRYEASETRYYGEMTVRWVDDQTHVAVSRAETPTDGYTTADARFGLSLGRGFRLGMGATNLFDEAYVDHLNANNPFTRTRIAEPGRIVHLDLRYLF